MRRLFRVISFLLSLLPLEAVASHEVMSTMSRGAEIYVGKTMKIAVPLYDSTAWKVDDAQVYVRLCLAEDRKVPHTSYQQYKVCYSIYLCEFNNDTITMKDTVTVEYNTTGGYADIDMVRYSGYRYARLQIDFISDTMPDDIFLELGVDVTMFSLSPIFPTTINTSGIYQSETNELLLTWEYVGGADEYDVEWLFVDNPSNALSLAYDFANATRITTSNNHYEVPLAYPRGTLLYRVRARGTFVSNGKHYPIFGEWSHMPSAGYTPYWPSRDFRYDHSGLEDSLTWQYTAVYAEEGKRKDLITFYDGTLRKRQEVTVSNTENVAIVSETFYDHVGRQALQSIPAPTPSRGVRYYGTGNSSSGLFNGGFEKADYDYDMTLTHALPFPSTAGSTAYHSANNPFLNNPHWINIAQTPADSGYTYSHTRYLNDGTDRVHSQSVPGEAFKMGGGRENRFYYGNPMQVELDRLFGNEVGDASHYQKMVTVDANGENTVAYYDMKERLIASAIIPSSNANLLDIDDMPTSDTISEIRVFNENSRSYTQSIVVATPTDYNFTYHVKTANALCDTCDETIGCIDCRYKVVFSLWDPEFLQYKFKDSLIINEDITLRHNKVSLDPGNYQLYKSIAVVNDDETDAAYEAYSWRQRSCIHFKGADIARCYTPCEEYAMELCGIDEPEPEKECYINALHECENPPQSPSTECEAKLRAMLKDMSPGGQYFDYRLTCCPTDSQCACDTIYDDFSNRYLNSICPSRFNDDVALERLAYHFGTHLPSNDLWNALRDNWEPEYAQIMLKYHPEYHLYQALCECGDYKEQHEFDSIFFNTSTYDEAYSLGLLNPLGMEINNDYRITDSLSEYQPFPKSLVDPFFERSHSCCPESIRMMRLRAMEKMRSYMSWNDNTDNYHISVWWLLFDPVNIAHGGYVSGCEDIQVMMCDFQDSIVATWAQEYNCSLNDARWLLFKSIYLYLREEIRQTVLPACLLACDLISTEFCRMNDSDSCCNCPSLQWGQYEWWKQQFDTSALEHCAYYLKADTGCSVIPLTPAPHERCNGYFQIRFLCNPVYGLNLNNFMASRDSLLQRDYEDCCADCEANANNWMKELNDYFSNKCAIDSVDWMDIRTQLLNLCLESCDSSKSQEDFSVKQKIDLDQYEQILRNYCDIDGEDYIRIFEPRPSDFITDCDCKNYQNALHTYGLTYWSDEGDIRDSLSSEGVIVEKNDIVVWNKFCIWQLYNGMLDNIDDTNELYQANFPEQFRCMPELSDFELCQQQAILAATAQDTITFYHILDSIVVVHQAMYEPHCMAGVADTLRITCHSKEFLYTLYYYDQADNLIKTIPPKGVHPIQDQATLDSVSYYRHNISRYDTLLPGFIHPQHTMVTNYKYNTLNQITTSYQPDHDSVSVTFYDILSRPVLSQNVKQRSEHKYSYTLYDSLGRIVEVGQVVNSSSISQTEAADTGVVAAFIADGTRTEIIRTYYDRPMLNTASGTNLRNRIAAVAFYPQYPLDSSAYQTATHYSYDIHGNVKRLVQDIPALGTYSHKLTYIDYEYDLVSGNVNKVWFQKEKPEQFMHRYRYDADNRLTHVYTSNITHITTVPDIHKAKYQTMERLEARYFYLPNGMLSRVELGQKNVQGTDYAYTLQGWLKDINGVRYDELRPESGDIGLDGRLQYSSANAEFCKDAIRSMLQYYQGDYRPVAGTNYYNKNYSAATPLYNGNISALTTNYLSTGIPPLIKFFRYDKLNRIKYMRTAYTIGSPQSIPSYNFSTQYSYDFNGNLDTLIRYNHDAIELHNINYQYSSDKNRLDSITTYAGLASSRYCYDAIGNLTQDTGEGLEISWNAAGKVDTIWKNGNLLSTFQYSATGQRQMKKTGDITDYYIHDASGNVMCIYRETPNMFKAMERPIYGSKRLGELKQEVDLTTPTNPSIPPFTIGMRQYELTDHLGNVMATILDRRQLYSSGNDTYKPYIVSTTDYYPFGYPMSPRSTNIGEYRYFFNGQEADNEVFGEVALHAFEYRMHDTRLGRFWSVDPLAAKYPWNSTYAFAENRVIDGLDIEGLEYVSVSNSGINPSEHKNRDGTYSFSLGESQFNNVSMVQWEGNDYFKIDKHMFYGERGWSETGDMGNRMTQWVYTDIQNFDPNTMHTYIWGDSQLQGINNNGKALNKNCAELSNAQANAIGTTLVNGMVSPGGALNHNGNTLISLNTADGIDYINRQLEAGNAVVVGVNYKGGEGTDVLGTEHYITITGRTTYQGVGAFTFMENAVSNGINVRDFKSNLLFPNLNEINGISPYRKSGSQQYRVTRIQKNR